MQTVVLSPEGTGRREVMLTDTVVPDVRPLAARCLRADYRRVLSDYYRDLTGLLFAARVAADYPLVFFASDLWHIAMTFHGEDRERVLTLWHLGHDLAAHLGYEKTCPPPVYTSVFVRRSEAAPCK